MKRGLTLLEVLVSAFILSVGLVGALNAIAQCAASQRQAEDRARALMFCRSKMEEIMKEPTIQAGTDRGQGVDTSTDYDWQVDIQESSNANLYLVVVSAHNRVSDLSEQLSALRRPDLSAPTDTSGATTTGATSSASGTP